MSAQHHVTNKDWKREDHFVKIRVGFFMGGKLWILKDRSG
jgi:hypothetical protein